MRNEKSTEQINIRIKPKSKNLLQEAASLEGVNLSQFIYSAAEKAAKRVLQQYAQNREVTVLSLSDWDKLVNDIDNPPALNKNMKRLLSKSKLNAQK